MKDMLEKMGPQKKYRLINSALEEFGNNTYEKASTNNILKRAGISKGLLYHFFDSKKSLYAYIEQFSINTVAQAVLENISWDEGSLLKRIKRVALIKFNVFAKYPYMIDFTKKWLFSKRAAHLKNEITAEFPEIYLQIYHKNIDYSLFKDNIDAKSTVNIIQWSVENICEQWLCGPSADGKTHDLTELESELDKYLKIFEEFFYK